MKESTTSTTYMSPVSLLGFLLSRTGSTKSALSDGGT